MAESNGALAEMTRHNSLTDSPDAKIALVTGITGQVRGIDVYIIIIIICTNQTNDILNSALIWNMTLLSTLGLYIE